MKVEKTTWKCNECGKVFKHHKDDGEYNDCPDEDCCGCLVRGG